MQLYLSRKKCYSENNTDTKAERGAKSIRRKKGGNKMEFVFEHATMIAVIAVVVIILAILASGYVKAPPDTAFIISGFQKGQRILIGKAGIKLPFFERLDKLSLKLVAIDVKTSDAVPTADYINIQVDAAVNIKVGDEPQKLQKASQNFLNRDSEYIAKVAREVLEGNMREIVGKMRLEEMVSDRQKFAELVKENAEPDLAAMGLDIICLCLFDIGLFFQLCRLDCQIVVFLCDLNPRRSPVPIPRKKSKLPRRVQIKRRR